MIVHLPDGVRMEATPVCERATGARGDYCDNCGDCLNCSGEDECFRDTDGEHAWVAVTEDLQEWLSRHPDATPIDPEGAA